MGLKPGRLSRMARKRPACEAGLAGCAVFAVSVTTTCADSFCTSAKQQKSDKVSIVFIRQSGFVKYTRFIYGGGAKNDTGLKKVILKMVTGFCEHRLY
jgi:hypothetical protein